MKFQTIQIHEDPHGYWVIKKMKGPTEAKGATVKLSKSEALFVRDFLIFHLGMPTMRQARKNVTGEDL